MKIISKLILRYRIWRWCKEADKLKRKYLKGGGKCLQEKR